MFKSKWMLVLVVTLFAVSVLAGCGQQDAPPPPDPAPASELEGTVTIGSSTSVHPLNEALAAAFMTKHPKVTINSMSIGSTAGIKAAIDGTADIGASSRELKAEEAAQLQRIQICTDGMAIIAHPKNETVTTLTLEQVRKIYAGEITNWKEVGGPDKAIAVITREEGSGTRGAFEDIVMGKDAKISAQAIVQPSSGGVRAAVAGNPDAIGYASMGYLDDSVKVIAVDGVAPTLDSIRDGSYPVSRPFLYVTKEAPAGLVKEFIDFCLSPEGQEIVAEDYVPL
jgi:phosphate transport system substrate-binding protein